MSLTVAATFAAAAPSLLAYNVSPSATFLNQALALLLWGAWVMVQAVQSGPRLGTAPMRVPMPTRGGHVTAGTAAWPLLAALALVAAGVALSWLGPAPWGLLPSTFALAALGTLAAAGVLVMAGALGGAGALGPGRGLFIAFALGLAVAGVLNAAVAAVQVFAPALADGTWIARSGLPGRAVGNLRQPNHLATMLLWGAIGWVALAALGAVRHRWAALALAALVFGVVLTASRTGLVSVLALAAWGALDRSLARRTRALLLAAPLLYALAWAGMAAWAELTAQTFGGAQRLAEADLSSSRFGIWANTLALIAEQPWAGTGWGHFNLAWTLTPFPGRPSAYFDHAHNLPLQLLAELGLPLGGAVVALLSWALWRAFVPAGVIQPALADGAHADADLGATRVAGRCAAMVVAMAALHSLLEYPLWYAHFLLPTAWAAGFALAAGAPAAPRTLRAPRWVALAGAGLALCAGSAFAVWDYGRVAAVFDAAPGAPPLAARIADGQRSVLFGHHADYAAATALPPPAPGEAAAAAAADPFPRTVHHLIDARLLHAWARHRAALGDLDAARHFALRLREFRRADAQAWFERCEDAGPAEPPGPDWLCAPGEPPARPWRHWLRPRPQPQPQPGG